MEIIASFVELQESILAPPMIAAVLVGLVSYFACWFSILRKGGRSMKPLKNRNDPSGSPAKEKKRIEQEDAFYFAKTNTLHVILGNAASLFTLSWIAGTVFAFAFVDGIRGVYYYAGIFVLAACAIQFVFWLVKPKKRDREWRTPVSFLNFHLGRQTAKAYLTVSIGFVLLTVFLELLIFGQLCRHVLGESAMVMLSLVFVIAGLYTMKWGHRAVLASDSAQMAAVFLLVAAFIGVESGPVWDKYLAAHEEMPPTLVGVEICMSLIGVFWFLCQPDMWVRNVGMFYPSKKKGKLAWVKGARGRVLGSTILVLPILVLMVVLGADARKSFDKENPELTQALELSLEQDTNAASNESEIDPRFSTQHARETALAKAAIESAPKIWAAAAFPNEHYSSVYLCGIFFILIMALITTIDTQYMAIGQLLYDWKGVKASEIVNEDLAKDSKRPPNLFDVFADVAARQLKLKEVSSRVKAMISEEGSTVVREAIFFLVVAVAFVAMKSSPDLIAFASFIWMNVAVLIALLLGRVCLHCGSDRLRGRFKFKKSGEKLDTRFASWFRYSIVWSILLWFGFNATCKSPQEFVVLIFRWALVIPLLGILIGWLRVWRMEDELPAHGPVPKGADSNQQPPSDKKTKE